MDHPFGTVSNTVFKVETTFPTGRDDDNTKFGTYYASAYTLADDPGSKHAQLAVTRRPDLFDKRTDKESLSFSNLEDAIRVAQLLEAEGRMVAGWENSEDWRKKYRGPLKTRVACETMTKTRTHMWGAK